MKCFIEFDADDAKGFFGDNALFAQQEIMRTIAHELNDCPEDGSWSLIASKMLRRLISLCGRAFSMAEQTEDENVQGIDNDKELRFEVMKGNGCIYFSVIDLDS